MFGLSPRSQRVLQRFEDKLLALNWEDDKAETSLDCLAEFTVARAREQIDWYASHKIKNRIFSLILRTLAIITLLIGLFLQITVLQTGDPATASPNDLVNFLAGLVSAKYLQASYIYIGLSGLALAADRWTGRSKALIRQTMAWMALSNTLAQFFFDYALEKRTLAKMKKAATAPAKPPLAAPAAEKDAVPASGPPAGVSDQAEASIISLIERLRELATDVEKVVVDETNAWSKEYDRIAEELTKRVKSERDALKPGSIEVKLVRQSNLKAPVTILLDGFGQATIESDSYLITNVNPGSHIVEAQWQTAADEPRQTSKVVALAAGSKIVATLTIGAEK